MSTSDPDFYEAPRFSPEPYEEPPRQRGCFFYGCLIAGILALLMVIAIGIGIYFLYRAADQFVKEYTSTVPQELPRIEMPAEQRRSLEERVEAFRKALDAGTPTEPLVLSGDDINAWIENHSTLKGKVYVTIADDQIKGKLSLPLSEILDIGLTRGRYLNGEAELKASLEDGVLIITIESFEVNGKRPPEQFLAQLRRENLAKDIAKDPDNAAIIRKLERVEIKDSRLIIKARARDEGTGPGAAPAPPDLPDQVLAPPDSARPAGKTSEAGEATGTATPSAPGEPKKP